MTLKEKQLENVKAIMDSMVLAGYVKFDFNEHNQIVYQLRDDLTDEQFKASEEFVDTIELPYPEID